VIEEEVKPNETIAVTVPNPFQTNLIDIKDSKDRAEDGLIEEPVTGSGNADLWTGDPECAEGGEGGCQASADVKEPELEPAE